MTEPGLSEEELARVVARISELADWIEASALRLSDLASQPCQPQARPGGHRCGPSRQRDDRADS